MAAGPSIDVSAWLEEQLAQASPDLLRSMVQTFAEALMSAEADAVCGAAYGERSGERQNTRNGYRRRGWDIRAGTEPVAFRRGVAEVQAGPGGGRLDGLVAKQFLWADRTSRFCFRWHQTPCPQSLTPLLVLESFESQLLRQILSLDSTPLLYHRMRRPCQ